MSRKSQESERGPWDFIMFGTAFLGFIFGMTGVIVAAPGVAITGLIAMCVGLLFFGLQEWLSD